MDVAVDEAGRHHETSPVDHLGRRHPRRHFGGFAYGRYRAVTESDRAVGQYAPLSVHRDDQRPSDQGVDGFGSDVRDEGHLRTLAAGARAGLAGLVPQTWPVFEDSLHLARLGRPAPGL